MPTISLADPSIYQDDVGKPTDGEKLKADLLTIINAANTDDTRIARIKAPLGDARELLVANAIDQPLSIESGPP